MHAAAPTPDHAGYFLLLNVAIGGGFPDGVQGSHTCTAATEPGHPMLVDYVAVWTRGGSGGSGSATQYLRTGGTLGDQAASGSTTLASAGRYRAVPAAESGGGYGAGLGVRPALRTRR